VAAPLIVIGLDGATFDLIRPWAADGRLPVLARMMACGAWAPLRSTLPPATFPAWTSLVTGVNPGRHGIFDFSERVPGTYRIRFVNGSYRRVPALWTRLCAAGRRVAVVTVPATYPPEAVDGIMVSGFDTPLTTAVEGSFVHPRARFAEIQRLVGRLPFADFQEVATGPKWHAAALRSLLEGIDKRATLAATLLALDRPDLLMVVFGESDTVAHHFWRFHDRRSPRYEVSPFGHAIRLVYEALDGAIGRIVAAAPPGATVAIVSDHGSGGAGDRVVHLNRRLAEAGLLGFLRTGRADAAAGWARAAALRLVPGRLQGALLRRLPAAAGRVEGLYRFGGVDWGRTVAYSEELDYHPSVWLNLRGREPEGTVAPAEYDAVRERVASALHDWRDEDGVSIVARVWRREELYTGAFVDRAPDLILELAHEAGYSASCLRSAGPGPALRRLRPAEYAGGKGRGMNGAHRRDGVLVLDGGGVRAVGEMPAAEITDVLPTLLALAGLSVPSGLDGGPLTAALDRTPTQAPDVTGPAGTAPVGFDREQDEEIAARLMALGYLEPEP
jgi:predicted AlkP superfamily phosphohydrolase/phosphomutase